MIHTDVTVRKVDGRYVTEWPMRPMPGDQVLMSVELFEQSIEALNGALPAPPQPSMQDVAADFFTNAQGPAPGHDLTGATRGACRATAPCPACRQRLAEADVDQTSERKRNYGHLRTCPARPIQGALTGSCSCDADGWAQRRALAQQQVLDHLKHGTPPTSESGVSASEDGSR